jgi:ABC-2 type transport system permease protein
MPSLVLSLGISVSFLLVLITGMTNANGYLFHSRDFEILNSLPVKTEVVFASKLLYLTVMNYFVFSFIYAPTLAVYAIFNPTDPLFWILAIFAFFLVPLFPLTLGSLIAFFLGRISPRFKYKNAVQVIVSLALTVLILILSFNAQIIETNPTLFATLIKNILSKTGEYAYKGIHLRSAIDYLLFVILSVVPYSIFYVILGHNYLSVNSRMRLGYVNRSYRMTVQEPTKQTYALIKKEIRRYFGTSIYVMNTIVGPLLSTVMMIYIVIQKDMLTAGLQQIIDEMGGNVQSVTTYFSLILTAAFIFTLSMITTTACSISIEGKQFWILKSAPVDPKKVFLAKSW